MREDAVSAVMGTILLVAVTVAASATIFVLIDQEAEKREPVQAVSWVLRESEDAIYIADAQHDTVWSDFEIRSHDGARVALNGDASAGTAIGGGTGAVFDAPVNGGDILSFCGDDGGTGVARDFVTIDIIHTPSGNLAHSFMLKELAAC